MDRQTDTTMIVVSWLQMLCDVPKNYSFTYMKPSLRLVSKEFSYGHLKVERWEQYLNVEGRVCEKAGDNCVFRRFANGALRQISLEQSNEGRWGLTAMQQDAAYTKHYTVAENPHMKDTTW